MMCSDTLEAMERRIEEHECANDCVRNRFEEASRKHNGDVCGRL